MKSTFATVHVLQDSTIPHSLRKRVNGLENTFNFLGDNKIMFAMDITSLYTVFPNNEGLHALKYF